MGFVKKYHHQIFPLAAEHNQRHNRDHHKLPFIHRVDMQNVAKHDGIDTHSVGSNRYHKKPQREESTEHQANDGIRF